MALLLVGLPRIQTGGSECMDAPSVLRCFLIGFQGNEVNGLTEKINQRQFQLAV